MLTRREAVIEKPFRDRRYSNHRRKVKSALPRIDSGPPVKFSHLDVKLKKLQIEEDRQTQICNDNIRLVHRMAIIMRTKRMDDINTSPKGPFERKLSRRGPRKPRSSIAKEGSQSFLETITAEVSKQDQSPNRHKIIEHRAPHGFCRVPRLGFGSPSSQPKLKSNLKKETPKPPTPVRGRVRERRVRCQQTMNYITKEESKLFETPPEPKPRQSRPKTARIKTARPSRVTKPGDLKSHTTLNELSSEAEGSSTLSSEESFSTSTPTTNLSRSISMETEKKEITTSTKGIRQSPVKTIPEAKSIEYKAPVETKEIKSSEFKTLQNGKCVQPKEAIESNNEVHHGRRRTQEERRKNSEEGKKMRAKREDSDEQVSSILLGQGLSITIDEASDEFYS